MFIFCYFPHPHQDIPNSGFQFGYRCVQGGFYHRWDIQFERVFSGFIYRNRLSCFDTYEIPPTCKSSGRGSRRSGVRVFSVAGTEATSCHSNSRRRTTSGARAAGAGWSPTTTRAWSRRSSARSNRSDSTSPIWSRCVYPHSVSKIEAIERMAELPEV